MSVDCMALDLYYQWRKDLSRDITKSPRATVYALLAAVV